MIERLSYILQNCWQRKVKSVCVRDSWAAGLFQAPWAGKLWVATQTLCWSVRQANKKSPYSFDAQPALGVCHLGADWVAQGSRSDPEGGNPTGVQPWWGHQKQHVKETSAQQKASLPPDKFLFIHESRRRHSWAEYETSCNCEGVQATHLSSTSWNTQLGVCVVVKIRLSGGILGAVEIEGREMNQPAKQLNNQFSSNIHSITLLTSVTDTLSVPYRALRFIHLVVWYLITTHSSIFVVILTWGHHLPNSPIPGGGKWMWLQASPSYPECTRSASRRQQNCSSDNSASWTFIR